MQCALRFAPLALGVFGLCVSANAARLEPAAVFQGFEAVEQVRDAHRLWPEGNGAPKPPLASRLPEGAFRARAIEAARRTEALWRHWRVDVTPEALQAELDRMARETRDPSRLGELFDALGGDARLAAEVLARPALVERQIRARYAFDPRFHAGTRRRAAAVLERRRRGSEPGRAISRVTFLRGASDDGSRAIALDDEQFDALAQRVGRVGDAPRLEESEQAFVLTRTVEQTSNGLVLELESVPKRSFEQWWTDEAPTLSSSIDVAGGDGFTFRLPEISTLANPGCNVWDDPLKIDGLPKARSAHTAVWTGSEVIVWGGYDGSGYPTTALRYDPATDSWATSAATADVPQGRADHTAVWTGTELIVWGGSNPTYPFLAEGGRYDPATDTWQPVSGASPAPWPRRAHSAVWTGTRMIVWGGYHWNGEVADGGLYDPAIDQWTATSMAGAPQPRVSHTAVWTGSEMILFGGNFGGMYLNTIGRYLPASDTWISNATFGTPPSPRGVPSAAWTGSRMLVFGGHDSTGPTPLGARFNPQTSTWTSISTAGMPSPRDSHVGVWASSIGRWIVWGGNGGTVLGNGALYDPFADAWQPMNGVGAPSARQALAAVWTGSELVLWGGVNGSVSQNSGSRYDPQLDLWTPMAPGIPTGVSMHTAIWTGTEMIVWGGATPTATQAGGSYEPATATWSALPIDASTPAPRYEHAAVWTGDEMIVWGGHDQSSNHPPVGGAYDPSAGAWRAIDASAAMPAPRAHLSAVWTGTQAIFWGGDVSFNAQNSGGRYDPATDTWASTSTGTDSPAARYEHTAVWTGDEMLVWGGCCGAAGASGAAYTPANDTWRALPAPGAPSSRYRHVAVWDGQRMIVAGGWNGSNTTMDALTGGLYDAAQDSWSPIAQPSMATGVREVARASAVWTGREMLLWGGEHMYCGGWSCTWTIHNGGGRYDPATNSWTSIAGSPFSPRGRRHHTAVWTGSAMLLWGGTSSSVGYLRDGGIWSAAAPDSPGTTLRLDRSATADLSWLPCGGATSYAVRRCAATGGACVPQDTVATSSVPQFTDDLDGPSMFYSVEALNGCGSVP